MLETTYYGLNIVEGTDIVNPLTVDNPNYEKIDEVMHDNAVAGVTLATEIGNATVHALVRENSDCAVIRFIATTNWKAGDTVTVDGVPVTALLPSGETLPDGAYVINANVLCILTGTNLTVYVERKNVESTSQINHNGTALDVVINSLDSTLSASIESLLGKVCYYEVAINDVGEDSIKSTVANFHLSLPHPNNAHFYVLNLVHSNGGRYTALVTGNGALYFRFMLFSYYAENLQTFKYSNGTWLKSTFQPNASV